MTSTCLLLMSKTHKLYSIFLLAIAIAGCERFPQDPNHSLERIHERGHARVGVIANPPWVTGSPPEEPGGVEIRLLKEWAQDQRVDLQWFWGDSQHHFERLQSGQLDIVVGGLVKSNPWKKHAGFSIAWYEDRVLVGVPPGYASPDDLEGMTVVTRPHSRWIRHLQDEDATVVAVEQPDGSAPTVAEEWEMRSLGLEQTDLVLGKNPYVVAVPSGENALLMSLENHLLQQETTQIEQMLREEAGR